MHKELRHGRKARGMGALRGAVVCLVLLAFLGSATLLFARPGGEKPSTTSTATGLAKYDPINGKKYTISYTTYNLGPVKPDGLLIKFVEEKFNVDIDYWNLDVNKIQEVMGLKLAAGEIPDVLWVLPWSNLEKYAKDEILTEVPLEVIQKHSPGWYKMTIETFPAAFDYMKVNGKIYALPGLNDGGTRRTPIIWRGDWLKKVGINKVPDTLAEAEDAFYKFARNDPDGNGKRDTYGLSKDGMTSIYGAFGYIPYPDVDRTEVWQDRNGKLVYGAVQPEMKDALKLLNKWYVDGVLDPEFITGENTGGYWALSHAFINGRIGYTGHAFYYHWLPPTTPGAYIGPNWTELEKLDPEGAKGITPGMPPLGPTGKRGTHQIAIINSSFYGFGKACQKEPDKIGKILQIHEWMCGTTYDNWNIASKGIKGVMWDYDASGIPIYKEGWDDPKVFAEGAGPLLLSSPTQFQSKSIPPLEMEYIEKSGLKKGGIQSLLFFPLPSYTKYLADLSKLRDETYVAIITGEKPLSAFDDFVKRWNDMGGAQMVKEANDWYATIKK